MLPKDTLHAAALQLFASSTMRRYMREATRLATESGLADELRHDTERLRAAQSTASQLLSSVASANERDLTEVELAVLLCALARAAPFESASLLADARDSKAAWIRGLGTRLLALGPPNPEDIARLEQQLGPPPGPVDVAYPVAAADSDDPSAFPRAA
jgi:hypothetical protein